MKTEICSVFHILQVSTVSALDVKKTRNSSWIILTLSNWLNACVRNCKL